MRPRILFLLLLPNVAVAYMPSFSGYDIEKCVYLSFEPGADTGDPNQPKLVYGSTQPVEGKGNATYFRGNYKIEGRKWSFSGESQFPLAGTTYTETAPHSGILECTGGCSVNGIRYLFETSIDDEAAPVWRLYERYRRKVRKLCPLLIQ